MAVDMVRGGGLNCGDEGGIEKREGELDGQGTRSQLNRHTRIEGRV